MAMFLKSRLKLKEKITKKAHAETERKFTTSAFIQPFFLTITIMTDGSPRQIMVVAYKKRGSPRQIMVVAYIKR